MSVVSSSYTAGLVQVDGRLPIVESHLTDDGQEYNYDYLLDPALTNPQMVLEERAISINITLAQRLAARLIVEGTEVPLTRYEFKSRMTQEERTAIRTLALTDEIAYDFMDMLDTGSNVVLKLARPGLAYCAFKNALTAERAAVIGAA